MLALIRSKQHSPIFILALAMLITSIAPFASDSYLPSLPAMTKSLATSHHFIQLTITLYLLGYSLSQLIYGPFSDRFGRRHVILVGLGIASIGSLFCALAPTIGWLLFARLVQGAGLGVSNSLFRAVMRDVFSGTEMAKMSSYVGMVFAVAPAIAPVIGGYIQASFDWRANFIFLVILVLCVFAVVWCLLPETNKQLNPHATKFAIIIKNYRTLLTSKMFLGNVACSSLAYSGIIAYCAISPFLFENILGLTPVQYGWLATVITVGLIFGQLLNALFVTTMGLKKMIVLGITLMTINGIAMYVIGYFGVLNVWVVILPTCLFLASSTFVFSSAMAGAFMPFADMAGSAGAMYGCLQILGSVLTSLLIASMTFKNQQLLATIFICLGSLSAIIYYFCLRDEVVVSSPFKGEG